MLPLAPDCSLINNQGLALSSLPFVLIRTYTFMMVININRLAEQLLSAQGAA